MPFLAETMQDRADGPDGVVCRYLFCSAAWSEFSCLVIEGLAPEFDSRERVLLLGEHIIEALCDLDG